jgi:hypothetical protein
MTQTGTAAKTQEFVTAEECNSPRRGVWVMLATVSMVIDGTAVPSAFVITTSTGYRAELRACMSDRCTSDNPGDVQLIRCTKPLDARGQHAGQSVDAWCKHVRTHCHGPHIEHARAFAAEVAATYGSAAKRDPRALSGLLAHPERVRNVSVSAWAGDPYAMVLEGRD